jgi:hypothetical protein
MHRTAAHLVLLLKGRLLMVHPRIFSRADAACTAAMLAYVTVVVVWYAVRSPLAINHDEHQFMARAFMVAPRAASVSTFRVFPHGVPGPPAANC